MSLGKLVTSTCFFLAYICLIQIQIHLSIVFVRVKYHISFLSRIKKAQLVYWQHAYRNRHSSNSTKFQFSIALVHQPMSRNSSIEDLSPSYRSLTPYCIVELLCVLLQRYMTCFKPFSYLTAHCVF